MSKKCLFEHLITAFLIPSEKFIRLLIHFLMNIFLSYIFISKKYLLEHLIIAFLVHWKQRVHGA